MSFAILGALRRVAVPGLFVALGLLAQTAYSRAAERSPKEIVGADISWVQQQEQEGVKFSDDGHQRDILAILKKHGFNYVRLRLFVDPRSSQGYSDKGYCDLTHTLEMARRVKAAHMKLLLDFHYSDNWADPAKQAKPAAWASLKGDELRDQVHQYTHDVLTAFTKQGTPPDIVQIGNEITGGLLWPDGKMWLPGHQEPFCDLLKAGISAVREVTPDARVMIHTATGGRNADCRAFFDVLDHYHVPFDIMGVSYYPRYEGAVDNLRSNLTDLAGRYPQNILVAEYTSPDQEAVRRIVHDLPNHRGLGAVIWEPTRWPLEGAALFDDQGRAKPAIDQFGTLKY